MNNPNWADITQAIASAIGIPGAIGAIIALIIRDKKRESQINSLQDIAHKLTQMYTVSENRYKNSKKPIVLVEAERFEIEKVLRLKFRNVIPSTTIKHFSIITDFPDVEYTKEPIRELNGEQLFSADLTTKSFNFHTITLGLEYATEENYLFFQYLKMEWIREEKKYIFHLTPMMDKDQFQYLANDR